MCSAARAFFAAAGVHFALLRGKCSFISAVLTTHLPEKVCTFGRIVPHLGGRFLPQSVDFITKQLKKSARFLHKKRASIPLFLQGNRG